MTLSAADLEHFSVHGWVVAPDAVSPSLCQRLRNEMDRAFSQVVPWQSNNGLQGLSEPHLRSAAFLDLFRVPGFIGTCRQLVGHRPRLRHCIALRTTTHPDAAERRAQLANQSRWDWHRDFEPDSIVRAAAIPGGHLTSQVVVAATYLTPTRPELGATAFLDGTHLMSGSAEDLAGTASIIQPCVSAGSIVLFSEALLHSATPVTTNGTRDAIFTWMTAPWFGGEAAPPFGVDRWKERELREIFAAPRSGDGRS